MTLWSWSVCVCWETAVRDRRVWWMSVFWEGSDRVVVECYLCLCMMVVVVVGRGESPCQWCCAGLGGIVLVWPTAVTTIIFSHVRFQRSPPLFKTSHSRTIVDNNCWPLLWFRTIEWISKPEKSWLLPVVVASFGSLSFSPPPFTSTMSSPTTTVYNQKFRWISQIFPPASMLIPWVRGLPNCKSLGPDLTILGD